MFQLRFSQFFTAGGKRTHYKKNMFFVLAKAPVANMNYFSFEV